MSDDKVPYGKDAQIITFGIHGTMNDPSNVQEVARRVSVEVGKTTTGANLFDNTFNWRDQAGFNNNTESRTETAKDLAAHVLYRINEAKYNGTLDPNKALTVNLVGFSHGGNVAMLAAPQIAAGLASRGFDKAAIHITTLATPAYTTGFENPDTVSRALKLDAVKFDHTHFAPDGDRVRLAAMGNAGYDTVVTRNIEVQGSDNPFDVIANHGAPQNKDNVISEISVKVKERFDEISLQQTRPIVNVQDNNSGQSVGAFFGQNSSVTPADVNNPSNNAGSSLGNLGSFLNRAKSDDKNDMLPPAAAKETQQSIKTNDQVQLADTAHPYSKLFTESADYVAKNGEQLKFKSTTEDVAATIVRKAVEQGIDPSKSITLIPGKEGAVFGFQTGKDPQDPATARFGVKDAEVVSNAYQDVGKALMQNNPVIAHAHDQDVAQRQSARSM